MKKVLIPLFFVPLFMVGCGKNKDVYASSKNTFYEYELNSGEITITGFNDRYNNQGSIIIPYSIDKHIVKKIDKNAFSDKYTIKKVDMSKSKLVEIGENAFSKCNSLESITYSKTIEVINKGAFAECPKIKTIDLSNTKIETISPEIYKKCSSLTDIKFPKVAKSLGSNVLDGCDSLTEINFTDTEFITFDEYALYGIKNLKKVTFPSTLKDIKSYALYDNRVIQTIDLSETSVESISDSAFANCRAVENIYVPKTLKTIGKKSFYYCMSLKKLDLSKTAVEEIPESAFELCTSVENISLSNVKKIGERAFYNSGIKKITIPQATTEIADDALRLCKNLKTIEVNTNNTSYTVYNDVLYTYDITELIAYPAQREDSLFTCPSKTTRINAYAFAEAANLKTVDLRQPLNLSVIDDFTFMNCKKLETIYIEDNADYSIKKIGSKAFLGCESLTSFDGLRSVKEIGDSAFFECINLASVSLGRAPLTYIGSEAFYGCMAMETLALPDTLKSIGKSAFDRCEKLETITYKGDEDELDQLMASSKGCGLESYYEAGDIKCNQ